MHDQQFNKQPLPLAGDQERADLHLRPYETQRVTEKREERDSSNRCSTFGSASLI